MNNRIYYAFITIFLTVSCGNTKYSYSYEMGRNMDFSKGKWILNKPYTNYNEHRIYDISKSEFKKILGDSLCELSDLRKDRMMSEQIPFEPSKEKLREIQLISNCDFLINIKSITVKNDVGSFTHSKGNSNTIETNQANVEIRIYDLNSQLMISQASVIGKDEVEVNVDHGSWTYLNSAGTISMHGLLKLIRKYNKYKEKNK